MSNAELFAAVERWAIANYGLHADGVAIADALRNVAQQIDRLERAGHAAVKAGPEATVLHCNGSAVVEALEVLAQRLAVEE